MIISASQGRNAARIGRSVAEGSSGLADENVARAPHDPRVTGYRGEGLGRLGAGGREEKIAEGHVCARAAADRVRAAARGAEAPGDAESLERAVGGADADGIQRW